MNIINPNNSPETHSIDFINSVRNLNKLIVRKEGDGLFVLRAFRGWKEIECVKASSAQMILDYVNANWPIGTKVQWIIVVAQPSLAVNFPKHPALAGEACAT
jgi:hypothetical protein